MSIQINALKNAGAIVEIARVLVKANGLIGLALLPFACGTQHTVQTWRDGGETSFDAPIYDDPHDGPREEYFQGTRITTDKFGHTYKTTYSEWYEPGDEVIPGHVHDHNGQYVKTVAGSKIKTRSV